jgi:hypothetical protein
MAESYRSFGRRVEEFLCPATITDGLDSAKTAALDTYRLKFATILFELYEHMDAKDADDFVRPLMQRLSR